MFGLLRGKKGVGEKRKSTGYVREGFVLRKGKPAVKKGVTEKRRGKRNPRRGSQTENSETNHDCGVLGKKKITSGRTPARKNKKKKKGGAAMSQKEKGIVNR